MALACLVAACSSSPLDSTSAGGAGAGSASAGASGTDAPFVDSCSAARAQQLGAIETVSNGAVQLLSNTGGVKTLYVDATAGGQNGVTTHPWLFVALGDATKAAVNDVTSLQSLAWDLAFKRALIYTNGGEGGPGQGASAFLDKDFANVTSADVASADFFSEKFFDDDCNAVVDLTGATSTSFSTWYNYDEASHVLSPVSGTWLVKGATGKIFKLRFESYYATPSGGTGSTGGAYLLEIGAL
jgi:hypothetical protein